MEEAELVRKMMSGDKDAFAGLMEIYQKQALRAAYLISGNYADSEDIVQETFTSCYINRKQIRDPEAFKGWFYKTLSRTAWRVCRKARREQPAEEVYPEEGSGRAFKPRDTEGGGAGPLPGDLKAAGEAADRDHPLLL